MNKPLTAFEYFMLDRLRVKCENIMQDPVLVKNTNVEEIYQMVMEQIKYETDPLLNNEIYTIPNILKPISC